MDSLIAFLKTKKARVIVVALVALAVELGLRASVGASLLGIWDILWGA